jgi:hypothetical protein
MKITPPITMASVLLLAAGCAHEVRQQARYDESISPGYSNGRMSEYYQGTSTSGADVGSKFMSGGTVGENPSPSHGPGYTVEGQLGSQAQSDNAIIAHVRESLQRAPEIALIVPNIQIGANNGAVALDGTVQSEEQRRQIESIAKRASGVAAVNNQLKVLSSQPPAGMDNPNGSQLSPTSVPKGEQRIYEQNGPMDNTNILDNIDNGNASHMP